MVIFMCQLDWLRANQIVVRCYFWRVCDGVSGRVGTWISRLSKQACTHRCRWGASDLLWAWVGPKGKARENSLSFFELEHPSSALRLQVLRAPGFQASRHRNSHQKPHNSEASHLRWNYTTGFPCSLAAEDIIELLTLHEPRKFPPIVNLLWHIPLSISCWTCFSGEPQEQILTSMNSCLHSFLSHSISKYCLKSSAVYFCPRCVSSLLLGCCFNTPQKGISWRWWRAWIQSVASPFTTYAADKVYWIVLSLSIYQIRINSSNFLIVLLWGRRGTFNSARCKVLSKCEYYYSQLWVWMGGWGTFAMWSFLGSISQRDLERSLVFGQRQKGNLTAAPFFPMLV